MTAGRWNAGFLAPDDFLGLNRMTIYIGTRIIVWS
jgi:hypothetical protein